MASRESINRVLIEVFRLSGMPIDPADTILQGDLLEWDGSAHQAIVASPSGVIVGMAETKNPIATMGSPELLSSLTWPRVNVIQAALVNLIAEESVTLQPYDKLRVGNTDSQHVASVGATLGNYCAVVDPKWAAGGKAVVSGDLVRCWLKVRPLYAVAAAASASAS